VRPVSADAPLRGSARPAPATAGCSYVAQALAHWLMAGKANAIVRESPFPRKPTLGRVNVSVEREQGPAGDGAKDMRLPDPTGNRA
jgi:hypothetical protein